MAANETTENVQDEGQRDPDAVSLPPVITDVYDVATLQNLATFDDAVALLTQQYGTIEDANRVIGSGFSLMDGSAKSRLVGEPFLIVHCMFPESTDYKNEDGTAAHYAVTHIITKDGRKLILTDGGTGIYRQLEEWCIRSGRYGGLMVAGGLRESKYELPDGSGEGTTYYLAV